ncbi:hypothetical protein SKAU_G00053060 [Synaphobranchus kaupii]|uniref:Amyloid-beta A4 precursor protein-binding family A member 3 n=1 Tax=Synaphobranchus kaupii TaxID=118154 RepID=A0A9Q1G3V9_SYNKA|nr:hypothetical protein SKAU_G00053060 [Synaphobranchus kaupii]
MEEQEEAACKGGEASSQGESYQPLQNTVPMRSVSPPTVQPNEVPFLTSDGMSETEEVDSERSETTQSNSPLPDLTGPVAASAEDELLHQNPKQEPTNSDMEDLDSFSLIEPPPLDWRSDSSSDGASEGGIDDNSFLQPDMMDTPEDGLSEPCLPLDPSATEPRTDLDIHQDNEDEGGNYIQEQEGVEKDEEQEQQESGDGRPGDVDHSQIQALLTQLQLFKQTPLSESPTYDVSHPLLGASLERGSTPPLRTDTSMLQPATEEHMDTGLLFSESSQRDLRGLLEGEKVEMPPLRASPTRYIPHSGEMDAVVSVSYSQEDGERFWDHFANGRVGDRDDLASPEDELMEPVWLKTEGGSPSEEEAAAAEIRDADTESHPAYKDVPGPCDPEDLLDGVIFGAKYLGSTQLLSVKNPSTNARMSQAQEAVDRIKAPEGESQPMTEVDLFISTQRIKVLSADTQEAMMDHPLQMISYIADIGTIVVLMARRKPTGRKGAEAALASDSPANQKKCCMICHVFNSGDAQVIAQAIGQAFGVAYQQFLHVNGIKPTELRPSEYSDYLGTQELYNGDLVHFSRSENIREVCITKAAGEILGLAVVESGWGSILPTVVVANLLHGGPAERSGELSIGDRVMSVNGISLVGLPISTCNSIIRDLKNQSEVKLRIVHCPPVTMAIIKRPDPKYQLGFSVEDGIICSLMRGGIAERGGIRVGHRIIEINGQSVVATPHEKIIHILTHAVGEIHLKTMPASTYRLLTGQEQPVFL